MNRKGSVLAYILVATVVVMIICASLTRLILARSTSSSRLSEGIKGKKTDDGGAARLFAVWATGNTGGADHTCDNTLANTVGYDCGTATVGAQYHCPNTCTCVPTPACTCPASNSTTTSCPPTITITDLATNGAPAAGTTQGQCAVAITSCQ
jgi:hypothetical protein